MRLITEKQLAADLAGSGHASVWRLRKADPRFPKPVKLGSRVVYVEQEKDDFIRALIAQRDIEKEHSQ